MEGVLSWLMVTGKDVPPWQQGAETLIMASVFDPACEQLRFLEVIAEGLGGGLGQDCL